ncbi:MAG: hypothetical protein JXR58_02825 [Bacteroidales bacterium]|nr:hypothetical protein [Bacteroidales bacterium]
MLVIAMASCNKEKFSDVQASEDDIFAQISVAKIFSIVNDVSTNYFCLADSSSLNPVVSLSCDTFPCDLLISFNDSIQDSYSDDYLGNISVRINDMWNSQSNTITITMNNFKVNDVKFTGTLTASVDTIFENWTQYGLAGNNLKVKFSAENEFSWNINQIVFLSRGTVFPDDFINDKYYYYGVSSGNAVTGRSFSSGITDSLVFSKICSGGSIISGKKELIPFEYSMRLIDYGSGNCDNTAVILSEGEEYYFEF